jgi:hypothetical protein
VPVTGSGAGLIISRVVRPASKLDTRAWWPDTTLGADLGIADASTGEIYTAMDWLVGRQDSIEKKLAAKHLGAQANPSKMALFDLSSTWMTGNHCELAARGYSRDGKKGLPQINFGLLGDREGRPVAVRVKPQKPLPNRQEIRSSAMLSEPAESSSPRSTSPPTLRTPGLPARGAQHAGRIAELDHAAGS